MSGTGRPQPQEGLRQRSFGETYRPTIIDRFGVWLSARRIRQYCDSLSNKSVGDFGCGYHATFIRTVLPLIEKAVLVDSSLAPDLKSNPRVTAIEGILPDALNQIPDNSLDIVLCVSVLEHLWNPQPVLESCNR